MHNKMTAGRTRSGDDGATVAAVAAGGIVAALLASSVAMEALLVLVRDQVVPFLH